MPVLKHAKKKLRQDKKRTAANKIVKDLYKDLIKAAKASPTKATLSKAFQAIDKAAKNHVLHANKAARLKSSLSKLVAGDKKAVTGDKQEVKSKKKAAPKQTASESSAPKTKTPRKKTTK